MTCAKCDRHVRTLEDEARIAAGGARCRCFQHCPCRGACAEGCPCETIAAERKAAYAAASKRVALRDLTKAVEELRGFKLDATELLEIKALTAKLADLMVEGAVG